MPIASPRGAKHEQHEGRVHTQWDGRVAAKRALGLLGDDEHVLEQGDDLAAARVGVVEPLERYGRGAREARTTK